MQHAGDGRPDAPGGAGHERDSAPGRVCTRRSRVRPVGARRRGPRTPGSWPASMASKIPSPAGRDDSGRAAGAMQALTELPALDVGEQGARRADARPGPGRGRGSRGSDPVLPVHGDRAPMPPRLGYYRAGWWTFGARGDFVTRARNLPLFGRTVARQVEQVLSLTGARDVIEIGAGAGTLAAQILALNSHREAASATTSWSRAAPSPRGSAKPLPRAYPMRSEASVGLTRFRRRDSAGSYWPTKWWTLCRSNGSR